jgi:hypothetical protein
MIHHYTKEGHDATHWGVSIGSSIDNKPDKILVQVNDGMDEARIALTVEQAKELQEYLEAAINTVVMAA